MDKRDKELLQPMTHSNISLLRIDFCTTNLLSVSSKNVLEWMVFSISKISFSRELLRSFTAPKSINISCTAVNIDLFIVGASLHVWIEESAPAPCTPTEWIGATAQPDNWPAWMELPGLLNWLLNRLFNWTTMSEITTLSAAPARSVCSDLSSVSSTSL